MDLQGHLSVRTSHYLSSVRGLLAAEGSERSVYQKAAGAKTRADFVDETSFAEILYDVHDWDARSTGRRPIMARSSAS